MNNYAGGQLSCPECGKLHPFVAAEGHMLSLEKTAYYCVCGCVFTAERHSENEEGWWIDRTTLANGDDHRAALGKIYGDGGWPPLLN